MGEDELYVFKPVLSQGGEGISFERGSELSNNIEQRTGSWVIQEFVDPFLYKGRKTHMRPLTLVSLSSSL